MRQMSQIIDDAKAAGTITSDGDLARKLDVTRATVSVWRNGRSAPSEDQAAALADLLGRPEIMAEAAATRAKTEKARAMWERVASVLQKCTTFGIFAALGFSGVLASTPVEAGTRTMTDATQYKLWSFQKWQTGKKNNPRSPRGLSKLQKQLDEGGYGTE